MKPTRTLAALAAVLAMFTTAACATTPDYPDQVGLYYNVGQWEGNVFSNCIEPGKTGDWTWNDEVVWLPTNLRTWTIDDMPNPDPNSAIKFVIAPGADSADVTVVSAKPEEGQPSGIQVKVATKTQFLLNTFCDAQGGVARQFWEKIGRRYDANTDKGWRDMLEKELVPTLKTILRDTVRGYNADALVANQEGIQQQVQTTVSSRLAIEFNRLAGGNFFCGPSFNRLRPDCPSLELLVIDVDFADPGIRAARNEKQKQIELAAAKLAEAQGTAAALVAAAQGEADAAAKVQALYNSPGWVTLQKQITQMKALIEACKVAKECRIIVGADGNLIMA